MSSEYLYLAMTAIKPHIFIAAAERSGDDLGAGLARALREQIADVELSAIGGPALAGEGIASEIDISGLAILGFVEGLKSYPLILQKVDAAARAIIASGAQAAILIDSWGFMIRVAKKLRALGYEGQIIKYVAPQVWAMREGRAAILAKHVDHLLTIHNFDAPYFTQYGLAVTYVGNPVFDQRYDIGDGQALRAQYDLGERPVAAVLFGSRLSEVQRLAAPFADAVTRIRRAVPDAAFISPMSQAVAEDVLAAAGNDQRLNEIIFLPEDRKLDVFAAANAALACSGTVSTQLASAGVPSVIAYRLSPITYFAAKRLFKPRYVSMINIASDAPLMPEFIQNDCTGENLTNSILPYLQSKRHRAKASAQLKDAAVAMKKGDGEADQPSSVRAAHAILSLI